MKGDPARESGCTLMSSETPPPRRWRFRGHEGASRLAGGVSFHGRPDAPAVNAPAASGGAQLDAHLSVEAGGVGAEDLEDALVLLLVPAFVVSSVRAVVSAILRA